MPDLVPLAKAELRELNTDFITEKEGGEQVKVQFNPETLNVTFSNQVAKPDRAGDQAGSATLQFIGAGSTSLSVTLWFDVNAPGTDEVDDVRKLTKKVVYFITPKKQDEPGKEAAKVIPPAVRFIWGSFQFDGVMDSLTESLEFFSSEGLPLRASLTFKLSQQKIDVVFGDTKSSFAGGGPLGPGVGTTPLVQAPAGTPLQNIVDRLGQGANWQRIAAANNIENPRILKAGLSINLNVS